MGDHSFNREHSGDVKGTHLLLLLCFTRLHFCLGLPPGSASKGRALQTDEDVGDRAPETGQNSPAGGLTDRQGRSLHPSRVQHLHLHLGAGQPQRGQKREQSTNVQRELELKLYKRLESKPQEAQKKDCLFRLEWCFYI